MPPTIFSPSLGYVENVYHPMEMNHLINQLNSQLEKSCKCKSLYVSLTDGMAGQPPALPMTPPVQQEQWLIPPTGPVTLAVPKPTGDLSSSATPPLNLSGSTESLARVFEMIGQESKQPLYNPYIAPPSMMRPPTTATTSTPSWSRPSFVIGAPSTGPSLNELPNPRKGSCRFFNTAQGCQQGRNCKFNHHCSVCGDEYHNAIEHYARPPPK